MRTSALVTVATFAALLVVPARAVSQQPSKPDTARVKQDSVRSQMEQASAMMVPMTGQMTEAMMEGMLKVMAKPENIDRLATFTRSYYEALIRKGFTKDEALQIVIAAGIPRMPTTAR